MSASARFAGALRSRGLALFAEVVWVGLLVALCSLPVVTALPAAAAGAARLRRHIAGEDDALNGFVRDLGSALRRGWLAGALAAAVGFALIVNTMQTAHSAAEAAEPPRGLTGEIELLHQEIRSLRAELSAQKDREA